MGVLADELRQRFKIDLPKTPIADALRSAFKMPAPAPAAPAAQKPTPIADALRSHFQKQPASEQGSGIKNVEDFKTRISGVESGGRYDALGPVISTGMYAGDRAYGKYQVMGKNLAEWGKRYLGRAVTPQEFVRSPELQEAMMSKRFEELYQKYGNWRDVQSVHFTGRPYAEAGGQVADQLGTTNDQYWAKVAGTGSTIIPKAAGANVETPATKKKGSWFLDTLLPKAQEIGGKINEAATKAVEEQKSVLREFGQGKYTVRASDVLEGVKDTIVGGAKLTGVLAQGFNEGIFRIAKSGAEAALPGRQFAEGDRSSPLTKAITGRDEISTYQEINTSAREWAKETGATPEEASIFAGMAVIGAIAMDSPIGGPGKNLGVNLSKEGLERVAREGSETAIKAILKAENPHLTDAYLEFVAPALKKATTVEEVDTVVRMTNKVTGRTGSAQSQRASAGEPEAAVARQADEAEGALPRAEAEAPAPRPQIVEDGKRFTFTGEFAEQPGSAGRPASFVPVYRAADGATMNDLKQALPERPAPAELSPEAAGAPSRLDEVPNAAATPTPEPVTTPRTATQEPVPAPRREVMTPVEASEGQAQGTAPQYKPPVNLVKRIAQTDDKFEVLNTLTKEFPRLPERVKDTLVNRLARLKRTRDIEGVLKFAHRLNGSPPPARTKLSNEKTAIIDRALPSSVGKIMSDSEKIAYIKSITDKVDTPEEAALAKSEYDRIMEAVDQKVIDHFNNIQMERDFLDDSLSYDEASTLYNRYYARFKSRDVRDLEYTLEEIMHQAQKKHRERMLWNRGIGAKKPQLTRTEEHATRLDTEIEELGFRDFDEAQEAVERYAQTKARIKELEAEIRELRPIVRAAEILRPLTDDIPVVLSRNVDELDSVINSATVRGDFTDIGNIKIFSRDVYRNFRRFFGPKYAEIKRLILDPFDDGKRAFVDEVTRAGDELEANVVEKFGFKRKSKESEWIQRLFDTDLPAGERRSADEAIEEFGEETYERMVEADKWFRATYNTYLQNVNEVRAKMYPNNPKKLVGEQRNYYRHFAEMDGTFGEALRAFFDTPAGIAPKLAGISAFTEPKSRFLPFQQHRLGQKTEFDAIGGFIDYIPMYAYAVHIDPHIPTFRYLRRRLSELAPVRDFKIPGLDRMTPGVQEVATKLQAERTTGYDNFLIFLNHFANDLAGKTNPVDRLLQEMIPGGRTTMQAIDWVNTRIKVNQILGNAGTGVAQLAGLPMGLASTGSKAFSKGMARTLGAIGRPPDKYRAMSTFLSERYLQSPKSRFPVDFSRHPVRRTVDEGRDALGWILQSIDHIGTETVWNAHLEEYLARNRTLRDGLEVWAPGSSPEDAVRYADGTTRDLVAGRGIGEVPILQKARAFQTLAPFMLEVEGFWHVIDDWRRPYFKGADNRNLTAIVTLLLANYVFNEFSERTRGSRVVFDPMNALFEGLQVAAEEHEAGNLKGAALAPLGRLAGEYLSNKALGQLTASLLPPEMREEFFGELDPTRFGVGFPIPATVGKVLTGVVEGDPKELAQGVMNVALPYGAKQIEKTWEGVETMLRGEVETGAGKAAFPVEQSFANWAKAMVFGQYATSEAGEYFEERNKLFRKVDRQEEKRQEQLAEAEKAFAEVRRLKHEQGSDAAKAYLKGLEAESPGIAGRVKGIAQADAQGRTGNDRLIAMLGVENGERSKYIVEQMRDMSSEERKAYLKELSQKKLISGVMKKQIPFLLNLAEE